MSEQFKFSTTGVVVMHEPQFAYLTWFDLSPGVRGCIAVMLEEVHRDCHWATGDFGASDDYSAKPGFRHLHPDTLARIIADVAKSAENDRFASSEHGGRSLWIARQVPGLDGFSPLTLYLDEAGKMCLRDV